MKNFTSSCKENTAALKALLTSEDILVYTFCTKDGKECAAVYADGMTDKALLGEALAREIIRRAKALGYSELVLDTLEDMRAARALYARLGFAECAPYYVNPIPGTSYMRLELK